MLTVSQAQMDAVWEALGTDILLARLRTHFEKFDPKWSGSMTPQERDRLLLLGIGRARGWGLETFDGIGVYICGLQSAPQFDRHPVFRAVLSDPALDEPSKIAALGRRPCLGSLRAAKDLGSSWEGEE